MLKYYVKKNFKYSWKDAKVDLIEWEDISYTWIGWLNIMNVSVLPNL